MDRTDTTSDEYQALLAQLVKSHDHGYGRFRRMAWGAKEDCEQCMTQERLMAEAREDFKVRFTDGTTAPVVDGLIGLTEDEKAPTFKGDPIKVTEQLYDGSYEAYVGDPDPEGYLRASGSTPEEAIENFLDLWDDEEDQAVNELIANEREYVDNITREAVYGLAFIVIGLFSFAVILTAVEGR